LEVLLTYKVKIERGDYEGYGRLIFDAEWPWISHILSKIIEDSDDRQEILDSLERNIKHPYEDQV
jgi:hypothetical protein